VPAHSNTKSGKLHQGKPVNSTSSDFKVKAYTSIFSH
jgi:hypothetical protein